MNKKLITKQKQLEHQVYVEYKRLIRVKGAMKMPIYKLLSEKYNKTPQTIYLIIAREEARMQKK